MVSSIRCGRPRLGRCRAHGRRWLDTETPNPRTGSAPSRASVRASRPPQVFGLVGLFAIMVGRISGSRLQDRDSARFGRLITEIFSSMQREAVLAQIERKAPAGSCAKGATIRWLQLWLARCVRSIRRPLRLVAELAAATVLPEMPAEQFAASVLLGNAFDVSLSAFPP